MAAGRDQISHTCYDRQLFKTFRTLKNQDNEINKSGNDSSVLIDSQILTFYDNEAIVHKATNDHRRKRKSRSDMSLTCCSQISRIPQKDRASRAA